MHTQIFTRFNQWMERILSLPGDDVENLATKKRFWQFLAPTPVFMVLAGLGFWIFDARLFAVGIWVFGFVSLLILITFSIARNHVYWFAMITMYCFVLFSFVAVLYFGGILLSGGVVFVGLAGAIASMAFLKPQHFRTIYLVYFLSVILEAILQPYLNYRPEITPNMNLISFVLHILVIAAVMFNTLSFFIEESIKAKQAEADNLRELDNFKTQFYTNITHEFRTPITVILGMADQISEKPQKYFRSGLNLIRRNGIRLLHLVNQMLDLSKIEANTLPIKNVQGDIMKFLRIIIEPFERLAEGKQIKFHLITDYDEIYVDFDPEKIESIIANLLSNAIKYTSKGGDVYILIDLVSSIKNLNVEKDSTIQETNDNVYKRESSQHLKLTFRDTGSGIRPDQLERIFDRFYQVENEKTKTGDGTGIGLAIVKELVKLLGGEILVKSKLGHGTTFTIYLPVTNHEVIMDPDKSLSSGMMDPELLLGEMRSKKELQVYSNLPHLLIVEDNEDVVQYIKSVLDELYTIKVAENGAEGIEMALENIPDIILSDVMMPEKNGFELCKILKSDFRTSHIPIVLLTAKADISAKISGLEQGADAYLTKPFNSRELKVRLQKLIELREKLKEKFRHMSIGPAPIALPSNLDEVFLSNLNQVLEENFENENFNISQFGNKIGLSRVQLFRKLKALTGHSASHLLRAYRLNKAKELIESSGLNISEIAYEVGFKDPAYFSRAFTKEFGFAPSTLRSNK